MADIAQQEYEREVPVASLTPHPRNSRQGNVGLVHESIARNDFYGACVVQRSTRHIIAGNHRYLAARQAGLSHVPVIWVDVDDERALRMLLVDNKASDEATYDTKSLAALLSELQQSTDEALAGTGYSDDELDDIIRGLIPRSLETDGDGGAGGAEDDGPGQLAVLVFADSPMDQDEISRKINGIGWIARKVEVTAEVLTTLSGEGKKRKSGGPPRKNSPTNTVPKSPRKP